MAVEKFMAQADRLRTDYVAQTASIASRADLSDGARLAALARATLKARAAMASIEASSKHMEETRKKQLTATLFGTEGLKSTLDPVSLSMSARDAGDRASKITTPQEAEAVLARAADTGDQLLARAVAHHAATMGYGAVLQKYADAHPGTADGLNELTRLTAPNTNIAELWAFVLPESAMTKGRHDAQLESYANNPAYSGAG